MSTPDATSHPKIKTRLGVIASWMRRRPHLTAVITLLVLGFITRFFRFGFPNQAVFDEVYFGKFASGYFTHIYFFDIHPPLGKLLIAGFAWLFQYNPTLSFASIGTVFDGNGYLILRFLPSLAGAILPVVFYALARELKLRTSTAFLVGLFICFENALITQSRFILIDSFLILFGFSSLLMYFIWRRKQTWPWLVAAASLAVMSFSVKWTGLTFLVIPGLIEIVRWQGWARFHKFLVAFIAIPIVLYTSFFMIHLSLLTKTGEGDAYMSIGFQKTLEGSAYSDNTDYPKLNIVQKFFELNWQMYDSNTRLTAGHPYSSKWYTWPFMIRPISYWVQDSAYITLFGNPLVWWAGTASIIWLGFALLLKLLPSKFRPVGWFIIAAYLINLLPFAGISRVMFLYHYFIPLGFSVLALGIAIEQLDRKYQAIALVAVLMSFLIFAPYTYGINIGATEVQLRTWLPSWR